MPHRLTLHNGIPEHSRWCDCLDCRVAWEDSQEAEYALRLLAAQDEEIRQAKLATDQEWAEFFDAEFPRVQTGATP
jgi:hypothetical protein